MFKGSGPVRKAAKCRADPRALSCKTDESGAGLTRGGCQTLLVMTESSRIIRRREKAGTGQPPPSSSSEQTGSLPEDRQLSNKDPSVLSRGQGQLHGYVTCAVAQGPRLVIILKFLILFEQGPHVFILHRPLQMM